MASPASAATTLYQTGVDQDWYTANKKAQQIIDSECAARGGTVAPNTIVLVNQFNNGGTWYNRVAGVCTV